MFTSWSEDHNSDIAFPMSDDEYQFDNQVDDGDIASPLYSPLSSLSGSDEQSTDNEVCESHGVLVSAFEVMHPIEQQSTDYIPYIMNTIPL